MFKTARPGLRHFSYGMHWCLTVVAHGPGVAGAVLLRAGAVVEGVELAWERRPAHGDPGSAGSTPWRYWILGDPRVSPRTGRPGRGGEAVRWVRPRIGARTRRQAPHGHAPSGGPSPSHL